MRFIVVGALVMLGAVTARADGEAAATVEVAETQVAAPGSVSSEIPTPVVKSGTLQQGRRTAAPLTGPAAWLIPGAVGTLVPIFFFAIPALAFAWFGPFAPVAFLFALVVGTIATGAGGAVAWGLSSVFSNVASDFFLSVGSATLIGLGTTFFGGALATAILFAGFGLVYAAGSPPRLNASPSSWSEYLSGRNAPYVVGASALAFVVWSTSVMVASIGGPMTAAYLFQKNGTFKGE